MMKYIPFVYISKSINTEHMDLFPCYNIQGHSKNIFRETGNFSFTNVIEKGEKFENIKVIS